MGVLRGRGAGLLAVDEVVVAVALGRSLERGEIASRARFREALAPPVVEIGDARQGALLLRLGAEGVDHRTDHVDAEAERLRLRSLLHLLLEDIELHDAPA